MEAKVSLRVHKSKPLVPILSQTNSLHTPTSYVLKARFNILSHLRLDLLRCFLPFVFSEQNFVHGLTISFSLI